MVDDQTFRYIETLSRIILSIVIVVGIGVAWNTSTEINELERQVKTGNCSYLLDTGYIQAEEMPDNEGFNFSSSESYKYNGSSLN